MHDWSGIDKQMYAWKGKLQDDLEIPISLSSKLASHISNEVTSLKQSSQDRLIQTSPIPVINRFEEIVAFQNWMDLANNSQNPSVTRAQVITQNYICFVYLRESWFQALYQESKGAATLSLCCEFLLSEPLRRFRNAFAHGNWRYLEDFSGIEFWARSKDSGKNEIRSEVLQLELNFWQALSRCIAYVTMQTLIEIKPY